MSDELRQRAEVIRDTLDRDFTCVDGTWRNPDEVASYLAEQLEQARRWREELPAYRETIRQKIKLGGRTAYLDVGFYDGACTRIGEVFIVVDKNGSTERFLLDELARMTSVAIQYGAPAEEVIGGWLFTKGSLFGTVLGDDRIKNATSVLDWVARHILVNYYRRNELAHVKEEST